MSFLVDLTRAVQKLLLFLPLVMCFAMSCFAPTSTTKHTAPLALSTQVLRSPAAYCVKSDHP